MRCRACNRVLSSIDMGRKNRFNEYLWLCGQCYGISNDAMNEPAETKLDESGIDVDKDYEDLYSHDTEYQLPDEVIE